jgi:hypothetical protein
MDKTDYLIMAGDENINYESLTDEELKALAKCDDLSIAGSAITELGIRQSPETAELAEMILIGDRFDRYAKATALGVLFSVNQDRALEFINREIDVADPYVFDTILDILVTNRADINDEYLSRIIKSAMNRLAKLSRTAKYPTDETVDSFIKTFA